MPVGLGIGRLGPVSLGISIGLGIMEQWTEQTSLRLLELIASRTIAIPAELNAGSPNHLAIIDVLTSLADSDPHFREWLRDHSQCCPTASASAIACENAPTRTIQESTLEEQPRATRSAGPSLALGIDWRVVAEQWLRWLAAEPMDHPSLASGDSLSDNLKRDNLERDNLESEHSASGEDLLRPSERSALYRKALVASAQAALGTRVLAAERKETRDAIARELAYDMAYGLSHELNNPLANIAARARWLAEQEANEQKKQMLAAIVDQAMRGCEMIADLMLIARPPVQEPRPVELAAMVREIVAKARPWAEARGLTLSASFRSEAAVVATDRSALAEALWALLRNALEAAQKQISVTVSELISVSSAQLPDDRSATVIVAVQDDGAGISPQALAHAFNPYFSGREAGRGLGIGLAKADRIARLSGGSVEIANGTGGGCVAKLLLPLLAE